MEDSELDESGLTSTIPAIGDGNRTPASLAPVGWLEGLAWPTVGALVSVGAIGGLGELRPFAVVGQMVWAFAFAWPVRRWFARPVRNRRLAAWSAGLALIALTCVFGVWLWNSPVLDDWRWAALQTGILWLAVITFVIATHVRQDGPPSNGSFDGPA